MEQRFGMHFLRVRRDQIFYQVEFELDNLFSSKIRYGQAEGHVEAPLIPAVAAYMYQCTFTTCSWVNFWPL